MDNRRSMPDVDLYPAKCSYCKKKFMRHASVRWAYKIKIGTARYRFYCCYSCYRAAGGDNPKDLDNHRGLTKEEYKDVVYKSSRSAQKGQKHIRKP
jgi:hypothetical protein